MEAGLCKAHLYDAIGAQLYMRRSLLGAIAAAANWEERVPSRLCVGVDVLVVR